MKKQSVLSKGFLFSLLVMVFVFGTAVAGYGASCGDVNNSGSVDIVDALMIAQAYVGLNPAGYSAAVADVNASGSVDIVDALRIAQYYVGLVTSLTCSGATAGPTATRTTTSGPTSTGATGCSGAPGAHVDNPFAGAKGYVNTDWASKAAANGAPSLANVSSAVWMDRIAAITGGSGSCTFTGLVAHLNRAVSQGATQITIVIYDLPNRDCSASASNGELLVANNGLTRYKTEYIDPIVAILKSYPCLRIVCFLEPDSTSNLVTNLSVAKCSEANSSGAYVQGIQYAIDKLKSVGSNVYLYLDAAHSAWLGWDSNFQPFVTLIGNMVAGTTSGKSAIDGFVDNSANTLPWVEPFIPDGNASVGGVQIKSSTFYDWNPYTQESTYVANLRSAFISNGFPSTIAFLVDTARNGWGGPNRPTAASTSTDVNTFVNASKIDRRFHRGNWCNQDTAGIGARPTASPASGVDAFVWIKPPGESDGQSQAGSDPCDPNKTLDNMCIPGGINTYCNCGSNGAMAGAPAAGAWFQAGFDSLVAKAYPAL